MQFFLTIFLISIISIIIHELGHCIAASLVKGVTVREYSIGVGKIIFLKKLKNFTFTIRLLPFGGSCIFEGLEYNGTNTWGHLFVALGGIIANIVTALICILLIFFYPVNSSQVTVRDADPSIAVLERGDIILAIDGQKINLENLYDMMHYPNEYIAEVQRKDNSIDAVVLTGDMYDKTDSVYRSKIDYNYLGVLCPEDYTIRDLLEYVFSHSIQDTIQRLSCILKLSKSYYPLYFLIYFVLFNILSVMTNSTPLYDLDGGYALVILLTSIRKKPLSDKAEERYRDISNKIRDLFFLCIVVFIIT